MAVNSMALTDDPILRRRAASHGAGRLRSVCDLKARQSARIRELGEALAVAGITALDDQAEALGLSRSTTWTILKGKHKASGLSATVINRMLTAPRLPPLVRAKVLEYVEEKAAGFYGHSDTLRRRFVNRLSVILVEQTAFKGRSCLNQSYKFRNIA